MASSNTFTTKDEHGSKVEPGTWETDRWELAGSKFQGMQAKFEVSKNE